MDMLDDDRPVAAEEIGKLILTGHIVSLPPVWCQILRCAVPPPLSHTVPNRNQLSYTLLLFILFLCRPVLYLYCAVLYTFCCESKIAISDKFLS